MMKELRDVIKDLQPGFYWVQCQRERVWEVVRYDGDGWWSFPGREDQYISAGMTIGPRLEPPA